MYISFRFLIMDEIINVIFWNIIISNFNYIFWFIMLLFIMKNYPKNFTYYCYFLDEIWFIFEFQNLCILTKFNYVFTKYKFKQIFKYIFFNVHHIKSVVNR